MDSTWQLSLAQRIAVRACVPEQYSSRRETFFSGGRTRPNSRTCASIVYMTTLSVAAARGSFSKIVEAAETNHERFEVTRNGSRVAVLLGADDYDALLETLAIVTDSDSLEDIRIGLAESRANDTFSIEEVRAAMVESRRPHA